MTPPIVVIVGQTGVGKTALAIALAKQFHGEIIAADSRTVYTGMDIGTAKPTAEERAGVPHFGFDVVNPGQQFSAYDFKQLAENAIGTITARGKLPIIVGGTGLYIDALLYNFTFRPKPRPGVRQQLQGLSIKALQSRLLADGVLLPENERNPRHLARLIESGEPPKQPKRLRPHTLVLGLMLPQEVLKERLQQRVETMIKDGFIKEVQGLLAQYGDIEALRAPGYKALAAYIRGELTLADAKQQFVREDLQLARRQRTWFRRSKDIHWLKSTDWLAEAAGLTAGFLSGDNGEKTRLAPDNAIQ